MSDPLATYLHDHLAGSNFAIELLDSLRDQYSGEPLGGFAGALVIEIEEDRRMLRNLADRIGKRPPDLKEAAAWLGEKVSRFKLKRGSADGLGSFQALETLALGILGKLALWRALVVIADNDDRVRGVDFQQLIKRAEEQNASVEESRLQMARTVFRATSQ
ncbi:MAG: hypothetical protein ACJ74Z_12560 [Bryobacteraceae bacterium]